MTCPEPVRVLLRVPRAPPSLLPGTEPGRRLRNEDRRDVGVPGLCALHGDVSLGIRRLTCGRFNPEGKLCPCPHETLSRATIFAKSSKLLPHCVSRGPMAPLCEACPRGKGFHRAERQAKLNYFLKITWPMNLLRGVWGAPSVDSQHVVAPSARRSPLVTT